ncbi:MAG TPA: nitroreductase family protein [Bacillales bacterium]
MTLTENKIDIRDFRKPEYAVEPVFLERWSPRSFKNKEVSDEVLFSLFEAAKWAPSASNIQPWRFVIARTETEREKFYSFIFEGNRAWCEKAPVLAVVVSKETKPNGDLNRSHAFDAGTAWGSLALQAHAKGLIVHGMGGFDPEKARDVLGIPNDYEVHAVIAIGYQDEKDQLPEKIRDREKPSDRRPLRETVFEGGFGESVDQL